MVDQFVYLLLKLSCVYFGVREFCFEDVVHQLDEGALLFGAEFGDGNSFDCITDPTSYPIPELRAVFFMNQVMAFELRTAHRYLIDSPVIMNVVLRQYMPASS